MYREGNITTGQLDRLDEELDRYKNIDNKIFLRRQEIIYNKNLLNIRVVQIKSVIQLKIPL